MRQLKLKHEIKKIVAKLKSYKPEKIILFGSAAYGRLSKDSDLDLLIIKETKSDPWTRTREADKYIDHTVPVDLLVYTPKEIEKRLEINDFFLKEVLQKGKVIYEK